MEEEFFRRRLTQLRMRKGVSARDMSLSLGQSESYINKIENGKALPSMQVFFYICDYFSITPRDFFDEEQSVPEEVARLVGLLRNLNAGQLRGLRELLEGFIGK